MPTQSSVPLPLPPQNVPLIDIRTGLMNPLWYEYLRALDQSFRKVRSEIP